MEKGIINAKKYGNRCLLMCFVIALLFLCSCSARKVEKSKTETKETVQSETTKVDSSKTTTIANSNVKIVDSSTTDEFTVEPVDNTKPITVNGKSYFNAKLGFKKIKTNKTTNKTENVSQIKQNNVKTQSKLNKTKTVEAVTKKSDRKSFLSLWWLLVLVVVYLLYRKYGKFIFS